MLYELIPGKVYYKIFDKSSQVAGYIYAKHRCDNEAKIAIVEENRQIIQNAIGGDALVILKQVHSSEVLDVDAIVDYTLEPEADASIATKPKIALAVQTADCVPVLLSTIDGKVIGAAHCGWKGSKIGIIREITNKMRQKGYAQEIKAIIGPAIRQASYEVDEAYYHNFIADDPLYARFFITSSKPMHYMFDLPGFVKLQLNRSDIYDIHDCGDDTYPNTERYPSYRRDCHLGTKYKDNILSVIMLTEQC